MKPVKAVDSMNFYRHRPLALALTVGMTVSGLSAYLSEIGRIFLFVGLAAALTSLYWLMRSFHDTAVRLERFLLIRCDEFLFLTAVVSLAMLLTSSAFFGGTVRKFEKAADGHAYRISAVVTDVRSDKVFGSVYEVTPDSIVRYDGTSVFRGVGIKGLLMTESGYAVGDRIAGSVRFYNREEIESMNYRYTSLLADKIVFACTSLTEAEFDELSGVNPTGGESTDSELTDSEPNGVELTGGESTDSKLTGVNPTGNANTYLPVTAIGQQTGGWSMMWIKLRRTCRSALSLFLDRDTDSLVAALLLGDKSGLGLVRRDFARIGASHLFALSGMHLVILTGMIDKLTRNLPRRIRIYLTFLFLIGYPALVGFPYSVVRAAVMMAIFKIGQLFFIDSDSITSLFLAGSGILLCDPPAVFDVGFVLSLTAALGVLLIGAADSERYGGQKKKQSGKTILQTKIPDKVTVKLLRTANEIGHKAFDIVMTTLGATCFLLPFQYLYFGEFSLMSVASALLLTPLCELILWIAVPFLTAVLCRWYFLVDRLGIILSILADAAELIARGLSDKSKMISLRYAFVLPVMLLFFTVIVVMMVKNLPNWRYALIPYGVTVCLIVGGSTVCENYCAGIPTLTAFASAHGDMLMLRTDKKSMLIDVSDGTLSPVYQSLTALDNDCVTEVDTFMLTHLHKRHITSVQRLCENIMVRNLLIPEPVGENDDGIAASLTELAASLGVRVYCYPHEETIGLSFGDVEITAAPKIMLKRSTHPIIVLLFGFDGIQTAYLGSSYTETDYDVPNVDVILLGTHGPIAKKELPETLSENTAVFSVGDASPVIINRKTVKPTDR